MRNDALLQLRIRQPAQRMKRSPCLERANPLIVFAFEEDIHLWPRGLLTFIFCACESGGVLRGRDERGNGFTLQDWSKVDVWLDAVVCCAYRFACERPVDLGYVCHGFVVRR